MPLTGVPPGGPRGPTHELVGIPISGGDDPILGALRSAASPAGTPRESAAVPAAPARAPAPAPAPATATAAAAAAPVGAITAVAVLERTLPKRSPGGRSDAPSSDPAATDRCAEERRLAEERCELATRVRAQAEAAADALRLAQRSYDEHEAAAVDRRLASRSACRARRQGRGAGRVPGGGRGGDAARSARSRRARLADRDQPDQQRSPRSDDDRRPRARRGKRDRGDPRAPRARGRLGPDLGRRMPMRPVSPPARPSPSATSARPRIRRASSSPPVAVPAGDAPPRRGRDARPGARGRRRAPHLPAPAWRPAGDDQPGRGARRTSRTPTRKRRWQLQLTNLVEAIVADAIEASALDFPPDHEFWGEFTRSQGRDIAHALSSLGYRFDGLGGWTDGRQPSQRDLSLALGYAGHRPDAAPPLADEEGDGRAVPGRERRGRRVPGRDRRRPHAGRDGGDARPSGRWAGRGLEPLGHGSGRSCSTRAERRRQPGSFVLVVVDDHDPQRLGGGRPDRRALLGRPGPDPLGQPSGSWIWLACARSASILRSSVAETSTQVSLRSDQKR